MFRLSHSIVLCAIAAAVLSAAPAARADYLSTVLADGPIDFWRLNESSGSTAANQISGRPSGTYTSVNLGQAGPRPSSSPVAYYGFEADNYAPRFTRDSTLTDRVEIGLNSTLRTQYSTLFNNSFTMEMWLNDQAPQWDGTTNYALFYLAEGSYGANTSWVNFYRRRTDGEYVFTVKNGDPTGTSGTYDLNRIVVPNPSTDVKNLGDNTWHHYAIVFDFDSSDPADWHARAYVDGQFAASGEAPLMQTNYAITTANIRIGNQHDTNAPWHGMIDEVAIYDKALSAAQVWTHYHSAIPEPGTLTLLALGALALLLRRRAR